MDLDELRSAQSRERQASQLQHLRDGFYEEAASFIRGLRTERERATANSEYSYPYDDPEVQRLTNEIQTAEEVVESLYERRVGKVVKMASFDAAGMAVDAEGLTTEESDLFETLVGDIESNRGRVLDALAGTAGGDGSPGAGGGAGSASEPAAGNATPTDAGHEQAAPDEDGPVHIGSGPAADGPVSTADEAARPDGEAPPEQAPTPASESPEAAAPESAQETSTAEAPPRGDARTHDASGDAGPPGGDAMDAASAMGGSADDDSAAPADPEATADATSTADPTSTADASAAAGSDTADEGGHQAVPPADGPPGADPDQGSETRAPTGTDAVGGVTAADTSDPTSGTDTSDTTDGRSSEAAGPPHGEPSSDAGGGSAAAPSNAADEPGASETLVRITDDVGEIFGVDGRAYDLSADDVAVLPTDNAELLVENGDAESLDPTIPFSGDHSNRS
ncbi:hypothetical protein [Haloglomus halophilum]|uniref:hypothetical protein n=1 Tax=Haloglomus halophilum TaxID=2962672 RepID=UPI0020C9480A|nr:hypothetical protein [Haloglomus halophilum]